MRSDMNSTGAAEKFYRLYLGTRDSIRWLALAHDPRKPIAQAFSGTACDCMSTDPETGLAPGEPEAATCVQDFDAQCVLQFTLINAAGCALHRFTSRVIHRLECFSVLSTFRTTSLRQAMPALKRIWYYLVSKVTPRRAH